MDEQQANDDGLSTPVSHRPRSAVFRWMLLGSAVVHLSLTPAMNWLGILGWATVPVSVQPEVSEPLKSIEIDIDWLDPARPLSDAVGQNSKSSSASDSGDGIALELKPKEAAEGQLGRTTSPENKPPQPMIPDHSTGDDAPRQGEKERSQRPDAGASDSSRRTPSVAAPAEKLSQRPGEGAVSPVVQAEPAPAQPVPAEQPKRSDGHPVASLGLESKAVDEDAAVNLLLSMATIRSHALGRRIGGLLASMPQWRSFFAVTEIDPVADLEHLLVVGPNLSRSSQLVAVVQHSLSPKRVRDAVDTLVQRPPKGRWLPTQPSAAIARADGAERLFVLSAPEVLVVAPPSLLEHLMAAPIAKLPVPPSSNAAVAHIKNPAVLLARLGVGLPASLQWVRLSLAALPDGAGSLEVEILDADPPRAARHAPQISAAINALTNPNLGALGALIGLRTIAIVDPINLKPDGAMMRSRVQIAPHQLNRLIAYVEGWVEQRLSRKAPSVGSPRRQRHPVEGKAQRKATP